MWKEVIIVWMVILNHLAVVLIGMLVLSLEPVLGVLRYCSGCMSGDC